MLRELKRQTRSFCLFFRTFGNDMEVVLPELNALCEGRHPLFQEEDRIVLDGSDGGPDYRMTLSPSHCGTFLRNPPQDLFALIMGTIDQPDSKAVGLDYYADREGVSIFHGLHAVDSKVSELAGENATFALRDSYLGWSTTGSSSVGGKPFLLGDLNDPARHAIFFDDNITATDPKIVDPIDPHHWPRRFCSSQLNGVHLVQAQPLESISNRGYFLDCIRDCEAARKAKLVRWELALNLLGNLADVGRVLKMLVGEGDLKVDGKPTMTYRPWAEMPAVMLRSKAATFEDSEDIVQGRPRSAPPRDSLMSLRSSF
jgi:hypothetical protein